MVLPYPQSRTSLVPLREISNVQIGSVEVVLIGGIVGTLGEGPLVQIMLQEPTARLEMKHFTPHQGNEYLDVRVVPEENDEP